MRRLLFPAILIMACASISFAQSGDYSKYEFYGGYSHNRVDTGIDDSEPALSDIIEEREGFHGFNTSFTGNLSRYIGLKADFAGHFKSKSIPIGVGNIDIDSSLYNFLGGVQIKDNDKEARFKPFAHALIGAAWARNEITVPPIVCVQVFPSPCPATSTESDTGLAGVIGGGIDIRAGKHFDIRAIQVDYNPTRVFDATQHNFRVGVGVVVR